MQKRKISLSVLGILAVMAPAVVFANQPRTPYLANPIMLNRYINKTQPNIAIIVDNSSLMDVPILAMGYRGKARQIDVIKNALMNVYPDVYSTHNISLITLSDVAKDMHWKKDQSQPSGYLFAPETGNNNIFSSNEPNFNPYNVAPIASDGTLQRSLGSGNGKQNYGFNKFKGSDLIGDVQTDQQYLPRMSEQQKNAMGFNLLVPLLTKFGDNFLFEQQEKNLNLLTKTITLSDGKVRDVLPSTIDYLQDHIKYRCQDSHVLVITNDMDEVRHKGNIEAIKQYSMSHPKYSSQRDAEGYLYNQRDFPNQHINTSILVLSVTDEELKLADRLKDVAEFGAKGAGTAVMVNADEFVEGYVKEFLHSATSSTWFEGSTPAVYARENPKTGEMHEVWLSSRSTADGWLGSLRMAKSFDTDTYDTMRYAANVSDVYLNTGKDVIKFSVFSPPHSGSIAKSIDTLKPSDFGLSSNEKLSDFVGWLTGEIVSDGVIGLGDEWYPQYRFRSNNEKSEKRYLGDITGDTIELVGAYSNAVNAPSFLVVGSNDGMLKFYHANPLYEAGKNNPMVADLEESFPYVYEFAYMPGGAKRSDGSTLMQSFKYRADTKYGEEATQPVHEYGISGQIAYRTTNKGQTFMVGSLGQGGFGAFALNVSGNSHHDKNNKVGMDRYKTDWGSLNTFLWDTNSTAFGDAVNGSEAIGHILGRPVIARVAMSRSSNLPDMEKDVRYVAVLPSGEFGDQNKETGPTLYIYDALGTDVAIGQDKHDRTPGKLIQKVTAAIPKGQNLQYKNSLSAPTLVDLTFDGVADIGYVGDLNGNLYRLDLRGDTPSDWTLELIYDGDPSQPITHAPSVSRYDRKNVVVFGTGSHNKKDDFEGRYAQQAIYGIFENDNFTGFKDEPLNSNSNFVAQTLSTDMEKITRNLSNNKIEPEDAGWRIDLSRSSSEALSQKPVVFNGTVFLQTYVLHDKRPMPDDAMCYRPTLSPDTWLFQINARTGGTLSHEETGDTRLEEMGEEYVMQFDSILLPTLKLVTTDVSSTTSKDGEMQNGNDTDDDLIELESWPTNNTLRQSHYVNDEAECNAIVTNGMTLICPPPENLEPGRISIMKRNAYH